MTIIFIKTKDGFTKKLAWFDIKDFWTCEKVNGNWIGKNYRSCCFDLEKWESK